MESRERKKIVLCEGGCGYVPSMCQCLKLAEMEPSYTITFTEKDRDVGHLNWSTGKMVFTGKADKSAKTFFDYIKMYVDEYIEKKLGKK